MNLTKQQEDQQRLEKMLKSRVEYDEFWKLKRKAKVIKQQTQHQKVSNYTEIERKIKFREPSINAQMDYAIANDRS